MSYCFLDILRNPAGGGPRPAGVFEVPYVAGPPNFQDLLYKVYMRGNSLRGNSVTKLSGVSGSSVTAAVNLDELPEKFEVEEGYKSGLRLVQFKNETCMNLPHHESRPRAAVLNS